MTNLLSHPFSHGHPHWHLPRWLLGGAVALALVTVAVLSLLLARARTRPTVHIDVDVAAPPAPIDVPPMMDPLPAAAPAMRVVQGPPLIIRAKAPRRHTAAAH